jgi:DNA-binding response OmpR family regulator
VEDAQTRWPSDGPPASRKKVLAVDDSPYMLALMRLTLTGERCQVLEAVDGGRALDLAAAERPDLVLLDVMLPGLDGLAVCRSLKADPATSTIPVIMLTARGRPNDVDAGLAAGASDYITKPFSPRALLDKVEQLLFPG